MPDTLTRYPTKGPDMPFTCSSRFPDENFDRHGERRKWVSVAPNGAIVIEYGKRPLIGTVVATYEDALALSNAIITAAKP